MKKHLTIAVFILVLGGGFALNRAVTPPPVLESERRLPEAFPQFTAESFADASFMGDFDKWAQDSFAFREGLRTLRAGAVFHVFFETDKDGLYYGDSGIGKYEKINEKNWRQAMEKINTMARGLNDGTFADGGFNIYAAAIPDKSLYAGKYLPGYDPGTARRICADALGAGIQTIDLAGALAARDFYKTDLHWSQPSIFGVADALGETMGFDALASKKIGDAYIGDSIGTAGAFKGAYAGQLALPAAPDALQYVSNPYIDSAVATYLDPKTGAMAPGSVYCPDALTGGGDPYGFFLNGPQPLIVLESAEQASGRTLYLFRDSFGSSLAPLFLRPYDRVVLIDLRYIDSRVLSRHMAFEPGADVLFLYSSQILNNPTSLLVSAN